MGERTLCWPSIYNESYRYLALSADLPFFALIKEGQVCVRGQAAVGFAHSVFAAESLVAHGPAPTEDMLLMFAHIPQPFPADAQ